MDIKLLKNNIEKDYASRKIAKCRYNALKNIVSYLSHCCPKFKDEAFSILSYNKKQIKDDYADTKLNKNLNNAEKQVVNDIFTYLINNVTENSSTLMQAKTQTKKVYVTTADYKEGLDAWVGENPKVLILGTMPGDISLDKQVYYYNTSHNSFWKLMNGMFGPQKAGESNKDFITSQGIALWDCLKCGIRKGSTDAGYNLDTLVPNDLQTFLDNQPTIKMIILNGIGKGSKRHLTTPFIFKHFFSAMKMNCEVLNLPSTANTNKISFDEKLKVWSSIKDFL